MMMMIIIIMVITSYKGDFFGVSWFVAPFPKNHLKYSYIREQYGLFFLKHSFIHSVIIIANCQATPDNGSRKPHAIRDSGCNSSSGTYQLRDLEKATYPLNLGSSSLKWVQNHTSKNCFWGLLKICEKYPGKKIIKCQSIMAATWKKTFPCVICICGWDISSYVNF